MNVLTPLARDLARALDPCVTMRNAGMEPDDWQRDLLQSNADRHLVLCSR